MRERDKFMEPLLEKAEQFGRSSIELLKLQSIDKTAGSGAMLFSRFLLFTTISIFALTLNIAIALWLGSILSRNYYGFLVVSGFYGLLAVILALLHPSIKSKFKNVLIKQLLN